MTPRSWLFIPGDSDRKLAKADASGADALILDLEDSVSPEKKADARAMVRAFLDARARERRSSQLWVRVNPLDDAAWLDLAAVTGGEPDGIMAPKIDGPADLHRISHGLDALEAREGLTPGVIKLLPVVTETAIAPFRLGALAEESIPRLAGLTWGAEDLATAIGASTNLDATGQWALTFQMARSMTLLAAKALGVQAIETLYVDFRDADGLAASSRSAAAEGFTGRIAIHPAQVAPINRSFLPSDDEIAFARKVIAAFADAGNAGTIALDGKMLDIPHLKQAKATVARSQPGGLSPEN